jgi:hypothetical protein
MPLIEVFEALLRHYSTGSEAFLRPRFATHIDLVGNFGLGRLKWPFCKIRPRVVVFFKEIGEVPKVVEDASASFGPSPISLNPLEGGRFLLKGHFSPATTFASKLGTPWLF